MICLEFSQNLNQTVKHFGQIGQNIRDALNSYKDEIVSSQYPDLDHSYTYPTENLNDVNEWLESADLEKEAMKLKEKLT